MALELYENGGALFLGQVQLTESMTFEIEHDAGNSPVVTAKGFAGVSPGAQAVSGTIKSAVPRSGFDFDYITKLQDTEVLDLVYFRASKKVKAKVFLMKCKETLGIANPAEFTADFHGTPVKESTL